MGEDDFKIFDLSFKPELRAKHAYFPYIILHGKTIRLCGSLAVTPSTKRRFGQNKFAAKFQIDLRFSFNYSGIVLYSFPALRRVKENLYSVHRTLKILGSDP